MHELGLRKKQERDESISQNIAALEKGKEKLKRSVIPMLWKINEFTLGSEENKLEKATDSKSFI